MIRRISLFLFTWAALALRTFATGEASTYFEIFVPPNNDAVGRDVCLIVTAIYDSTTFQIVDDGMDGDTDDSVNGLLMAGQSYVLFIRENGVNDDAPHPGESATKQDGDYFIVTSDKLMLASQSTKSDWQHDWVPATNKSSRGTRFFIYSPPTTNSPRDLNVFAYDDSTTVTIKQVSTLPLNGSGYTQVNLSANQVVAQRELMVGEEILWRYPEGRNILQPGHTYLVETNKPVTVQYGALWGNARDGGGYVPSANGSSAGELFYFAVPYQSAREQEIRIVSWDAANSVSLDFYQQGAWVNIQSWTLDALEPADWISYSGNRDGVFRVTCEAGKKVSVFEANWLETGSPGTSDVASMLSSRHGTTAGTEFLAYMAPPGYENRVSDPFTNTKFTSASHLYIFAQNGATVQVTDAYTGGQVINRTYQIQAGRYVDAYLTLPEWQSIYNGDGNPNSGPERPYLFVSADQPISVFNTNFNDNWMAYCGTSLTQGFGLRSETEQDRTQPGDTLTIRASIDLAPGQTLVNPTLEVLVGDGGIVRRADLDDLTDQTTYVGSPEPQANTGQTLVRFDSLPALDGSHQYQATTEIVISANYHNGNPIPDQTVIPVDYSLSGNLNGVYQQAASSEGVTNRTSNQAGLLLAQQPGAGAAVTDGEDTWGFAWVDYNGDGYQDLFVPTYDPQRPSRLYRNQGNGTFTRVMAGALTSDLGSSVSATWGDYDNDGDPDVFVANNVGAVNHLYRNDNGTFTRVDAGALSAYNGYCHSAAWIDYDMDGRLDLFVTDYMPTRFNTLWHNDGDGTFSLATGAGALVEEAAYSLGAVWADYDLDGDPDLFVPNDRHAPNSLYRNEGNGQFAKILGGDIGTDQGSSVGASWGDYDNDGDPDLFVANAGNQPSFLYRNDGGNLVRVTTGPLATDRGDAAGSAWADVDQDGDLDLFVTQDQGQAKRFYLNQGDGTFVRDSMEAATAATGNSFAAAWADYDRDGDPDLYFVNHSGEANVLYRNNRGQDQHWLAITLIGTRSNRSAIGARVRVRATIAGQTVWQTREVSALSGGGAGGQGSLTLHLGLGDAPQAEQIEVYWPSGYVQTLAPQAADQYLTIVEDDGAQVSGQAYLDANQNCQRDAGEPGLPGRVIEVLPGPFYVTTNDSGYYALSLPLGSYTVHQVAKPGWQQSCPVSGGYSLTASAQGQVLSANDFANQSLCQGPDLSISMGFTALRRGQENSGTCTIHNRGPEAASPLSVQLDLGAAGYLTGASLPWDAVTSLPDGGRRYQWTLPSLPAFGQLTLQLTDSIAAQAAEGATLDIQATATTSGPACATTQATTSFSAEITGSVDPNDMLVFPAGIGPGHVIRPTDTLYYRIRFQNLGNAPAARVEIRDTLPATLDISTLRFLNMSHPGLEAVSEDGVLRWVFDPIYLPDSLSDEAGSHGFVDFAILPQPGLPAGTRISHQAWISFDYQAAIVTPPVFRTIGLAAGAVPVAAEVMVWPQPMTAQAQVAVQIAGTPPVALPLERVDLYGLDGRYLHTWPGQGAQAVPIDRGPLRPGAYLLRVRDSYGRVWPGRLLVGGGM